MMVGLVLNVGLASLLCLGIAAMWQFEKSARAIQAQIDALEADTRSRPRPEPELTDPS
jgi:hypothetical protein